MFVPFFLFTPDNVAGNVHKSHYGASCGWELAGKMCWVRWVVKLYHSRAPPGAWQAVAPFLHSSLPLLLLSLETCARPWPTLLPSALP